MTNRWQTLPTTRDAAIQWVADGEAERLRGDADRVRAAVDTGVIPYYFLTLVPPKLLTEAEEWAAYMDGYRRGIADVLGYSVDIEPVGPEGNGHGSFRVTGGRP